MYAYPFEKKVVNAKGEEVIYTINKSRPKRVICRQMIQELYDCEIEELFPIIEEVHKREERNSKKNKPRGPQARRTKTVEREAFEKSVEKFEAQIDREEGAREAKKKEIN